MALEAYFCSLCTVKPSVNISRKTVLLVTQCLHDQSSISWWEGKEDLRAWDPIRPSLIGGEPEKLTKTSVPEDMSHTMLADSALTRSMIFHLLLPMEILVELWFRRQVSNWLHTDFLPPPCTWKGNWENGSISLMLPAHLSWAPLTGFPGGKGDIPTFLTPPKPTLASGLSLLDQAAEGRQWPPWSSMRIRAGGQYCDPGLGFSSLLCQG